MYFQVKNILKNNHNHTLELKSTLSKKQKVGIGACL